MSPLQRVALTWFFWGGFVFLLGVGVWAIRTIRAMKANQLIALAELRANTLTVQTLITTMELIRATDTRNGGGTQETK